MTKSLLILVAYLMAGACLAAGAETFANFTVDAKVLDKGPRTFAEVLRGSELERKFPDYYALDALHMAARKNGGLIIRKRAYLLDKPVGFFNDQTLLSERWLEHTRAGEKLTRVDDNHFRGTDQNGNFGLDVFFDSDDISNVQDRRLIHAMNKTKQLDPLAGSSAATVVMVKHGKKGRPKEVTYVNYISLNAKQTIVIAYGISLIKWPGDVVKLRKVREGVIAETPALVQRTNSF